MPNNLNLYIKLFMPITLLLVGCDTSDLAEKCDALTKENAALRKEIKSLNAELIRLSPDSFSARQVEYDEGDSVRQKMRNLMIGEDSEPVILVQIEVDYLEDSIFVNGEQIQPEEITKFLLNLKASSADLGVEVHEHRNVRLDDSHREPTTNKKVLKREDILHQIKKAGIDHVRFLIGSP